MLRSLVNTFLFMALLGVVLFADNKTINIDILSKQAIKEQKHLLLFFHKFGCSFCEKMIDTTLDNEKIEARIEKYFIFVDIGIDDEGTIIHKDFNGTKHDYAKFLEISFYPTVGFVDKENKIVHGVIGYRDTENFLIQLKYIDSMSYKTMEYEAFKTYLDFLEDE